MWGEIEVGSLATKIEFLNYSSEYHDEALEVMRKSFFQYETVSVGSEINKNEEAQRDLEKLCDDALIKSNVSLVARDAVKNKIIGVAINVIQVKKKISSLQFGNLNLKIYSQNHQPQMSQHTLKSFVTTVKLTMQNPS